MPFRATAPHRPHRRLRLMAGFVTAAVLALVAACTSQVSGTAQRGPVPAAQVTIPAAGSTDLNPTTPVVVTVAQGRLTKVTVTDDAKGSTVAGTLAANGASWTSSEQLGYAATYTVVADAVAADGTPTEKKGTVKTLTPAAQAFPAMTPAPPSKGATFGVGQIIGVSFDQKITDRAAVEKALTVTTNPPQPGSWHWIDGKTLHYRPPQYWQPGTTVKLDVKLFGVNLGSGVYGKTDRSATYQIHDSWIAKADGQSEQMQIVHNGQVTGSMPVSIGKDATPTHTGPHVISDKQPQVVMDSCSYGVCPPDPGAYRSTEFWAERISNDGEFVHENPATVGQQGNSNVSHGCINLSPENAQAFFGQFGLGDVVEVTNSGGPPLPIYDTYGDWELNWADWQKGSALNGH
jgi:lipoprotein-anchoring transpeptidase ErfK/SrfK